MKGLEGKQPQSPAAVMGKEERRQLFISKLRVEDCNWALELWGAGGCELMSNLPQGTFGILIDIGWPSVPVCVRSRDRVEA